MRDATALALLMLSELPGVGEQALARVRQHARERQLNLAAALALPAAVLERELGLPPAAVARLADPRHEAHCRELLRRLRAAQARVRQPDDADYPLRWCRRGDPPPPVIHLYGEPRVLAAPTVAVLGSRTVTERTVSATVSIIRHAAEEGFTVVTGGMKTTHRIAAAAVRATAARRAIVLDRGLFAMFGAALGRDPFGFGPGRAPFDAARTLVLSPFRPDDHAAPRNGRRRDELIAALGDIVIAASARAGGEIERTCLRALDRGQCVLSWQGENGGLLAAGATAIDEADLQAGLSRFLPRA